MWMIFTGGFDAALEWPDFDKRVVILQDIYQSNYTVADLYEAWALYAFANLCISYIDLVLNASHHVFNPLREVMLSGILGFVMVTAGQSILKLSIAFLESSIMPDICETYADFCHLDQQFQGAGFVASAVAIFNIRVVENEFHTDMIRFKPTMKFWATKVLVSIAFIQEAGLFVANTIFKVVFFVYVFFSIFLLLKKLKNKFFKF